MTLSCVKTVMDSLQLRDEHVRGGHVKTFKICS